MQLLQLEGQEESRWDEVVMWDWRCSMLHLNHTKAKKGSRKKIYFWKLYCRYKSKGLKLMHLGPTVASTTAILCLSE